MVEADDRAFMTRALFLAERGRGRTTPNPIVGAVVVSPDGVVVGQGAHVAAGSPHAEVHALDAAGARALGATLYCTLEPCCHQGRTGPCVDRIRAAGIARVVVASRDPNPLVDGRGLQVLRAAGVAITEGVGAEAAHRQLAPFQTWVTKHRPLVTLKVAVSADGFVGRAKGRVKLSRAEADRWVHSQRAEVDAIAVGSETVRVDDPRLTPRGPYRFRPLTRVVFDWRLRTAPAARVFSTLAAGPVIMIVSRTSAKANQPTVAAFERLGVAVEAFAAHDLVSVLEALAAREVQSLVVEGGPALHSAFEAAGLVDRVQRIVTPHVLGHGVAESPATSTAGIESPAARTRPLGDDVLMEWDVHRPDRGERAH